MGFDSTNVITFYHVSMQFLFSILIKQRADLKHESADQRCGFSFRIIIALRARSILDSLFGS